MALNNEFTNREETTQKTDNKKGVVFVTTPEGHRVLDFTALKKKLGVVINKRTVAGALVGFMLATPFMGKFKDKNYQTDNNQKEILQTADELAENLVFDPNNQQEIIDRIANIYVEAYSKNLNGPKLPTITVEQWMDFYTVAAIEHISPAKYYPYIEETKTATEIMENFDYICNLLLEYAITATPSTSINISELVADKKSATELENFQRMLATYNAASESTKKQIAEDINKYLYDEFVTINHDTVDPSVNLIRLKLLRATWELTVNKSWTVPSAELSKILYPTGKCDLSSETKGLDVWNDQKAVVRQMLEEKLAIMHQLRANANRAELQAQGILMWNEIEDRIQASIAERGHISVTPRPDSRQAIVNSKPKTSSGGKTNNATPTQTTTKKETVVSDNGESKKQVLAEIEKENKNEELRVQGALAGAKDGNTNGYNDGSKKKAKNLNPLIDLSKYDKIYADAYLENYKKYYEEGYAEGQKLAKGSQVDTKEVVVDEKQQKKYERELRIIMIENGEANGRADGDQKGYDDGYKGRKFNDYVEVDHDNDDYIDAYIKAYQEAYKKAYNEGKKDRQKYPNTKQTEQKNDNNKKNNNNNPPKKEEDSEYAKYMAERGKIDGHADGDQKGYDDGLAGKQYNDTVKVSHTDDNYVEAYIKAYKAAYAKGYSDGQKDREKYGIKSTTQNTNNQNTNTNQNANNQNNTNTNSPYKKIEENGEVIEIIPNFYIKDGKMYDENGREVDSVSKSSQTNISQNIAALKTLRSVLSNMNTNTKQDNLGKIKTA